MAPPEVCLAPRVSRGDPVDRQKASLCLDARKPCVQRTIATKIESTLVCDVRVGVERDVGEREPIAHEKLAPSEVRVEHAESVVPFGEPGVELPLARRDDVRKHPAEPRA